MAFGPFGGGGERGPSAPIPTHLTPDEAQDFTRDKYAAESARLRVGTEGVPKVRYRDGLDVSEAQYKDVQLDRLENIGYNEIGHDRASRERAALAIAEEFHKNNRQLVERESELIEQKNANPSRVRKFFNTIRHNRKVRIGINVGLSVAVAGAAVLSGGTAALVAGGAKMAWRAASGYFAGEAAHDALRGRKIKKKVGAELEDFITKPTVDADERDAMEAKLSSHETTQHLDETEVATARDRILQESVDELRNRILHEMENSSDTSVMGRLDAAMAVMTEEIDDHLAMRREQITSDRKSTRMRRITGVAVGAALVAAGSLIHEVTHHVGGGGSHGAESSGSGGGTTTPEAGHGGADTTTGGTTPETSGTGTGTGGAETGGAGGHAPTEYGVHNPDAVYGAENGVDYGKNGVALATLKPGESVHKMAGNILSRFNGWDQMSPADQASATNHLAEQLALQPHDPGDRIRWTYEQASGSFNFPSAEVAATAHDQITSSGLETGGVSSPETFNNPWAEVRGAHSPDLHNAGSGSTSTGGTVFPEGGGGNPAETVTGSGDFNLNYNSSGMAEFSLSKGMSSTQLAEQILGKANPDQWNGYNASQQALKARHLANQLAYNMGKSQFESGANIKVPKDLVLGSLNYER